MRYAKSFFLIVILGVAFSASDAATKKEKASPATSVVDSGSFGVFVNGKRVATETFNVQQNGQGSSTTSQFKIEDGSRPPLSSEWQLTSTGELRRYEWKDGTGKSQTTVEPREQLLHQQIGDSLAYIHGGSKYPRDGRLHRGIVEVENRHTLLVLGRGGRNQNGAQHQHDRDDGARNLLHRGMRRRVRAQSPVNLSLDVLHNDDRVVSVLRGKLLLKALGNNSVVERLIAFERANNPTGDQIQWLNAAIRRWERDNDRR